MSIPRKMFSSFQKPLNSVTSRGHQQGAQVVMRGAADRPLAVAAVSIAAAASLAWLSRRRHRRRLAFTEAHVLAAMLRSGAISSAALSAGMTVPCWWCHSTPLRLRAALRSSDASPHCPGLHGRPCGLGEGYPRKPPTLRTVTLRTTGTARDLPGARGARGPRHQRGGRAVPHCASVHSSLHCALS